MKVDLNSIKIPKKPQLVAPIPLERPEEGKSKSTETMKFKLLSNPSDADGPTYEMVVKQFRTGTPEDYIKTIIAINRVLKGQNINTGPDQYSMVHRILLGETLTAFNNAATQVGNETIGNLKIVFKKVAASVFPIRAYAIQKQSMRRFMRKPRDMKIQEYVDRLQEINDYLVYFPTKDGEAEATKLPEEEIMDILLFGIPNSWSKKMVELGFDTLAHTPNEFIEVCERISFGETDNEGQKAKTKQDAGQKGVKSPPGSLSKSPHNSNKRKFSNDNNNQKYCPLHKAYGHDANDCKVIQSMVKKQQANWEAGGLTNYKRQKKETQAKKTEQIFNFMVKAFKEANSNDGDKNEKNGNKKRKSEDNYAFDEDIFDEFDLHDSDNEKDVESDKDSDIDE